MLKTFQDAIDSGRLRQVVERANEKYNLEKELKAAITLLEWRDSDWPKVQEAKLVMTKSTNKLARQFVCLHWSIYGLKCSRSQSKVHL